MKLIDKDTTKEEVEKEYISYPSVLGEETLADRPWYWNRLGPLFYECPFGSTVLDFGANTGEFVELLEKDRGCRAYGVDISEVCVKEAKEKGRNVELSNGDKLAFPDNSFDVVFLNEVLVHVFDPKIILSEIKRVLKPSGFVLGSTPHKNLENTVWDDSRMHRRYYNEVELEKQLYEVFDTVHLRTLTGGQFAFTMAQSALGNEPAEILFKCGGKDTKNFEEALNNKNILRVWMGFSHPPADVYYRMSGFADKMREKGAEIAYESYDHNDLNSTADWQKRIMNKHVLNQFDAILKCADMSVWQITSSLSVIAFLRCARDVYKKPLLTEVDDWLFDLPSYNMASVAYKPNSDAEWCAYEQLKLSDGFIVSTKFLSDSLGEMFPDKPIYIVKNSIDFKLWDGIEPFETIPKKKEGVVRIGYSGCGNHDGDVELLREPILALLDEYPNLEIVMSMQFESWKVMNDPRIIYVNKWLPFTKFPRMIKGWDLDIGIAPLRDNNLNRAKSNLRWLEYSALKLPSVMSKVQPFSESVMSGRTGYLCNSKKDWYHRLKGLIESKEERERIGMNAYREVKENFNLDKVAEGYAELLKQIKKDFK